MRKRLTCLKIEWISFVPIKPEMLFSNIGNYTYKNAIEEALLYVAVGSIN